MFNKLIIKSNKVKNNLIRLAKKVIDVETEASPDPRKRDSTTELVFKIKTQKMKKYIFTILENSKMNELKKRRNIDNMIEIGIRLTIALS
jgi:hypothetical protein